MCVKNLLFLVAISLLACGISAAWTQLAEISSLAFDYGTFTDAAGNIHLAYCKHVSGSKAANLYYAKLDKDGKLSAEQLVYKGADCRSAAIVSTSKGDKIYVAFSEAKLCSVGAYACASIMFTESGNGVDWSQPIAVHQAVSDPLFRYNPLILLNEGTGRVWVAFKSHPKEDPTDVYVVSRPPGSVIFSREINVAKLKRTSMIPGGLAVALTSDKKDVVIHMVYLDREFSTDYMHAIYYKKSTDNGNTWSYAKEIYRTNLRDSASPFALTVSGTTIYVAFSRTDSAWNGVWLSVSTDFGVNWTTRSQTLVDEHLATAAQVCTVEEKERVYMLAQDQLLKKSSYAFGYWGVKEEKTVWLGNPFGTEVDECFIPKLACSGSKVVKFCKLSKNKDNDVLVYQTA